MKNFLTIIAITISLFTATAFAQDNNIAALEQEIITSLQATLRNPDYQKTLDMYEQRFFANGTLPSRDGKGYRTLLTKMSAANDMSVIFSDDRMVVSSDLKPLHFQGLGETLKAFEGRVGHLSDDTSLKGLHNFVQVVSTTADLNTAFFCKGLSDAISTADWEKPFYQDIAMLLIVSVATFEGSVQAE